MLLQAQPELDVTAPMQASLRVSYDEDPLALVLNQWAACNLHGTTPGPRQDSCVHLSGLVVPSQPVGVRVSLSLEVGDRVGAAVARLLFFVACVGTPPPSLSISHRSSNANAPWCLAEGPRASLTMEVRDVPPSLPHTVCWCWHVCGA